uniref:ShKT domain-containing protein n=1 Tax=Acrobeloides nanus TaxID=290746 RepID=A0A914EB13_9BILA
MGSSTVVAVFVIAAFGLATAYQCSNNVLTDADRDFILNLHNSARSNVAKGSELNGPSSNTATVPGAKNMYKMVYDCKAEAIIQAYTNKCVYQHSGVNMENLWQGSSWWGVRAALNSAGTGWWGELRKNGVTNDVINSYTFNSAIGHWSMMAWHDATRIGCGVTNCTDSSGNKVTIGSCVYFWGGNMGGRPIWPIGTACASDADCNYYLASTCEVSTGLCKANCVNYLSDTDCNNYLSQGYCADSSKYAPWVQARCPVACNKCPNNPLKPSDLLQCSDSNTYCPNWKTSGYCDPSSAYYSWMISTCPLTCDVCTTLQPSAQPTQPPTQCIDSDDYCPNWEASGYCDPSSEYYDWMQSNCPLSCGVC